ncbi:hypothetical protein J7T55_007847 [Diaporthe amygdali]|uniref:uncharacterized protein n=1 Tax=Phomopsis amygdali TaxID=1214568 RepID=UPI0022FEFABF|nr:uncharacterized protein J7T55_007847 [Diaporthe amygdali]KAJ0114013.1 hypothetical protein J7T55_007847 [Diaporthe amygdali]
MKHSFGSVDISHGGPVIQTPLRNGEFAGIAENRPLGSQNDIMRVARKGYAWKPRRGFEKEDQTKHDKIVGGAEVLYGKAYR